jgi:O-acetyl-ADP-ribose deacetylase (regulator of RNase III)
VFGGRAGVSFGSGDLLRADIDAIVSPANGAGIMDGGIDRHYRAEFGLAIETRLRALIEQRHGGELPVGEALVVPTKHAKIRRMIAAPTMLTPRSIQGTDNVRHATLAALRAAGRVVNPAIARLGFPGMGTGVGRMDPFAAAEQMRDAIDAWTDESRG